MQLSDLTKSISQLTDEELLERLRTVRHNRSVVRPAARKHVERAEKRETRTKVASTDKLLQQLTPEQMAILIKQLKEEQ